MESSMAGEPTHGDLHRAIGKLEGLVDSLDQTRRERDAVLDHRYGTTKAELAAVRKDVSEIKALLDQGRGGMRVLISLSAIAGAVAGWIGPSLAKKLLGVQ